MADLVETVALELYRALERDEPIMQPQGTWKDAARAAIAAVLDDMAEPSQAMLDEAYVVMTSDERHMDDAWQAMLAQYREEMGNHTSV